MRSGTSAATRGRGGPNAPNTTTTTQGVTRRMRKLALVVTCLLVVGFAQAQDIGTLGAGDFGLAANVSTSTNYVGFAFHPADSFVIMPEVGFNNWNYDLVAGTTYYGAQLQGGIGLYYEAHPFTSLYLDVGPKFSIITQPKYISTASGTNGDELSYTSWTAQLTVAPKVLLTRNLAIYTELGVAYTRADYEDKTTNGKETDTYIEVVNPNLGIIYYFR